jgi:hypothetical protein
MWEGQVEGKFPPYDITTYSITNYVIASYDITTFTEPSRI